MSKINWSYTKIALLSCASINCSYADYVTIPRLSTEWSHTDTCSNYELIPTDFNLVTGFDYMNGNHSITTRFTIGAKKLELRESWYSYQHNHNLYTRIGSEDINSGIFSSATNYLATGMVSPPQGVYRLGFRNSAFSNIVGLTAEYHNDIDQLNRVKFRLSAGVPQLKNPTLLNQTLLAADLSTAYANITKAAMVSTTFDGWNGFKINYTATVHFTYMTVFNDSVPLSSLGQNLHSYGEIWSQRYGMANPLWGDWTLYTEGIYITLRNYHYNGAYVALQWFVRPAYTVTGAYSWSDDGVEQILSALWHNNEFTIGGEYHAGNNSTWLGDTKRRNWSSFTVNFNWRIL